MKFTVDKALLGEAAVAAANATPARPSVPVLAGARVEARNGQVILSGYDYETSTETCIEATVAEPGTALVSARLLAGISKALPNKPVEVSLSGAHLELVCGSARFTLPTMPVEDYPTLPEMPDAVGTISGPLLAEAVNQVAIAASRDETLPMMTGVRIEIGGGKLAMLATDRYRLALREIEWKPDDPEKTLNLLVPAKFLASAAKSFAGDVTIAHSGRGAGEGVFGLWSGSRRMTSRLLDGENYPPVRSLFPKQDQITSTAVVETDALVAVVKRVSLVAEKSTPVVLTFTPGGTLLVEAGGTEDARAYEETSVKFQGDQSFTIAFNPQYLTDGLSTIGAAARFSFVDPTKAAVIDGVGDDAHRYLLMPIRTQR